MIRNVGFWFASIIAASVLCFFGFCAYAMYAMNGHPIPLNLINATEVGDSTNTVLERLGTPSRIVSSETGDSWVYSGMTWCYVTVYFDEDGRVETVVHDH